MRTTGACDDTPMLSNASIVVAAAWGEDRAVVRRDSKGELWVSHWKAHEPHRVAGTQLQGPWPAQIHGTGWSAIGGTVPKSAKFVTILAQDGTDVAAEVTDGAWIAFVPEERLAERLPPIGFQDEVGALVAQTVTLTPTRTLSNDEAQLLPSTGGGVAPTGVCPVCGAENWQAGTEQPGSAERIWCGTCGYSDGAVYRLLRPKSAGTK
jgi:hypothetical protein